MREGIGNEANSKRKILLEPSIDKKFNGDLVVFNPPNQNVILNRGGIWM